MATLSGGDARLPGWNRAGAQEPGWSGCGVGEGVGWGFFVEEAAGLVVPEFGVGAAQAEQVGVRALLDDLAAVQDDQLVHAGDRAQTVRDHERGAALHEAPEGLL